MSIKKEVIRKNNEDLLNDLHKNTQMAIHSIINIIPAIKNEDLKVLLLKQKDIYESISIRCNQIAKSKEIKLGDINVFLRATRFVSIKTKAMMNKEVSHHANMLIQGTTMGITDIITSQANNSPALDTIRALARDLQTAEEEFVDSLKLFLTE